MSQPPTNLAANEIVFFFETNRPIPAADVGRFLAELGRIARAQRHLGTDGVLELVEVQTGTLWTKLAWIVGVGGGLAGIGSFVLDVTDKLQSTDNRLAQCTAKMVIEHGIRATTVITCQGSTEILRDMMPQVEKLERMKVAQQARQTAIDDDQGIFNSPFGTGTFAGGAGRNLSSARPAGDLPRQIEAEINEGIATGDETDTDYLVTEDGDRIVKEDGDPIALENVNRSAGRIEDVAEGDPYLRDANGNTILDEESNPLPAGATLRSRLEIARRDGPMPTVDRSRAEHTGSAIDKQGWTLLKLDGHEIDMMPITAGLDLFPTDWKEADVRGYLLTMGGRAVAFEATYVSAVDA